jgi:hypothetical protein
MVQNLEVQDFHSPLSYDLSGNRGDVVVERREWNRRKRIVQIFERYSQQFKTI